MAESYSLEQIAALGWLPPDEAALLRAAVAHAKGVLETHGPSLSSRQSEVIRLLVGGLTMKAVARRLNITPRTVAFHKYTVMAQHHLRDNSDLLRFAIAHGILTI